MIELRVLHVLPSIDDGYGGPGQLLASVLTLDRAASVKSTVVACCHSGGTVAENLARSATVHRFTYGRMLGRLMASRGLLAAIWRESGTCDVLVTHGIFDLPTLALAVTARARQKPLIVSPHGSLDPYDVRKHELAKNVLAPLWRWILTGATVWAITDREAAELVDFGGQPALVVLPPPFAMPGAPRPADTATKFGMTATFLGRFDVKKGIPRLISAFEAVAGVEDRLILAGSGEESYVARVDSCVRRSPLSTQISRPGWLSGDAKAELLAESDVFVLASDNENFGMAVIEAMALGVPVVVTNRVAVSDMVLRGAGLVTTPDVESFAKALDRMFRDESLRASSSARGPEIVFEELSARSLGPRYRRLLDDALKQGRKPLQHRSFFRGGTSLPQPLLLVPRRLRTTLRRTLNKVGVEVTRDPYSFRLARTMETLGIGTVVDIGANEGQYALSLRAAGFAGRIISVEPLARPYGRLSRRARADPAWEAVHAAVSDSEGRLVINIAENSVSSSALGILEQHVAAEPSSAFVGVEEVRSTTVDTLLATHGISAEDAFLKIDVQGLEPAVLRGALATLKGVPAVQLELSLVPLYEEQMLMPEVVAEMAGRGFSLWLVEAGFNDPKTGRSLQCDGVFVRNELL